ncbi:MAG: valine--tRNA ligase, partial [Clostridiales bacterium]|nr:valine--tRNA ligase [Clostridiales bacterium]
MDKAYDFNGIEPAMRAFWRDDETYKFDEASDKPVYSIDTPPPTISGSLHMGHIFSYTQAEIIARYKRMRGYNVFYPFGFDDNGLPTERLVEKEEGILAKDLSREDFNKKCVEKIKKYTDEFKSLWQTLGFSCDWRLQYDTVSEEVKKLSQSEFIKLIKSGDAYLKKAPILWCTTCQTSIAQAELEDKTLQSQFHTIIFKRGDRDLHIATTRPELLGACVAVLVHPDDARYKSLAGGKATVPLYGYEVPIIADESVVQDKGTGIVMCCTFGDAVDMEWVRKYDLPVIDALLPDGKMSKDTKFVAGMNVKEARRVIVQGLTDAGLLVESKGIEHSVAVHDRCGTPNEIIPSAQWYISTLKYRSELLEYGARVGWYPSYMKKKYDIWVENLKWDWCVSRQRFFGVPIPVWYCADCGEVIAADEKSLPVNPITDKPPVGKCKCGCQKFIPETSVLDTWATSSITPEIDEFLARKVGYKDKFLPCSMRTHAHEIIRTWSFYTILRSFLRDKDIPWRHLMICGFVLAKKGEKLSKGKANSIYDPKVLTRDYPADMIRYCAASTKLGTDTFFAEKELEEAKRMLTKVWNVSKYVDMQLKGYEYREPEKLMPADAWIIEKAKNAMAAAAKYLDEYEAGLAKQTINSFFWSDFCDNYVEISKERV